MKKLFALLLVLAMCACLCACDVDELMDGVSGMLDGQSGGNESPNNEIVYDQMIPVQGSGSDSQQSAQGITSIVVGEDGKVIYGGGGIVTDENGTPIFGTGEYEIEVIDGVIYVNGEAFEGTIVRQEEGNGDGAFNFGYASDDTDE